MLREMQANITTQLRDFRDAGIRGPDFVWAATGPALEAFSKHPVVRRTDTPGSVLTVAEFLRYVCAAWWPSRSTACAPSPARPRRQWKTDEQSRVDRSWKPKGYGATACSSRWCRRC